MVLEPQLLKKLTGPEKRSPIIFMMEVTTAELTHQLSSMFSYGSKFISFKRQLSSISPSIANGLAKTSKKTKKLIVLEPHLLPNGVYILESSCLRLQLFSLLFGSIFLNTHLYSTKIISNTKSLPLTHPPKQNLKKMKNTTRKNKQALSRTHGKEDKKRCMQRKSTPNITYRV